MERLAAFVLISATMLGALGAGNAPPASGQVMMPCSYWNAAGSGGGSFATVSEEGPHEIGDKEIVELESDVDGEVIQIALFRPADAEPGEVPVIVDATPYLHDASTDLRECDRVNRLVENFVEHGYAVAFIPVRGTGGSGGCHNLMGPLEQADLDQAITWLGEQTWSNGNVAMTGLSYDGSTPWEVASHGNPHLETIVPISGVTDLYTLMFNHGAPDWRGTWLSGAYYYESLVTFGPWFGTSLDTYDIRASCPTNYAAGSYAGAYSHVTGERDPNGFWMERDLRPGTLENYEGSVLLVHGLQDWNVDPSNVYPWIHELEEQGTEVKHLLGQWGHAYPDDDRADWADLLLAWFDHHLKEQPNVDTGPPVEVQDSDGDWRGEASWPPADASQRTLHLAPDERLAEQPAEETGQQLVAADPTRTQGGGAWQDPTAPVPSEEVLACQTCAFFTHGPIEEEMRIAGIPEVDVRVTPSGPGGHVAAYLYEVDDGDWTRIGWGQLDLRFPDGGHVAQPVEPGEPMRASIPMEPLDAAVDEEAELGLVLHQGTYGDRTPSSPAYPVTVHTGQDQSRLAFQAFERSSADLFEPPT